MFESKIDYNPYIILVFSNCIAVIEAKLKVFRAYRATKHPDNFLIHHDYDDHDDISKLSAVCKATFVCDKIKVMTNSISEFSIRQSLSEELGNISMKTIVLICAEVALEQGEQNIATKGHEHPKVGEVFSLQMLLQGTMKRTCKLLGFLIFKTKKSIASGLDVIHETIPQEIYESMLIGAMNVHIMSEYESKFSFGRPSVDESFAKFIRKAANNLYWIVRDKKGAIENTFMETYKKTMRDLKNVSLTLEYFKRKCQPSNMSECK